MSVDTPTPYMQPSATSSTVVQPIFSDDVPVNQSELAAAMRVSRWTVHRWVKAGYRFEFGTRTTVGHAKNWLPAGAYQEALRQERDAREQEILRRLRR